MIKERCAMGRRRHRTSAYIKVHKEIELEPLGLHHEGGNREVWSL